MASAPLSADGHVNVSPKGMDCFRVINPNQVAYLDMTGSGKETSAHLLENGRITIMFCALERAPRILRLYGTGRTVHPDHKDWNSLAANFTLYTGTRQIIVVEVQQVQTSCGFAVPFFEYQGERETLVREWEQKGENGLHRYWQEKNQRSVDGLPSALASEFKVSTD